MAGGVQYLRAENENPDLRFIADKNRRGLAIGLGATTTGALGALLGNNLMPDKYKALGAILGGVTGTVGGGLLTKSIYDNSILNMVKGGSDAFGNSSVDDTITPFIGLVGGTAIGSLIGYLSNKKDKGHNALIGGTIGGSIGVLSGAYLGRNNKVKAIMDAKNREVKNMLVPDVKVEGTGFYGASIY